MVLIVFQICDLLFNEFLEETAYRQANEAYAVDFFANTDSVNFFF